MGQTKNRAISLKTAQDVKCYNVYTQFNIPVLQDSISKQKGAALHA